MQSTKPLLWLLLIIAFQAVLATPNKCDDGYECIDIRKCDRYAPHLNRPDMWSESLMDEFRSRICKTPPIVTNNEYKVCCEKVKRKREALLDLQNCGAPLDARIAYGNETQLYQNPWIALLRYQEGWRCAGTLINERYILTAAFCAKDPTLEHVTLGEFDLSTPIDCDQSSMLCAPAPQNISIERIIIHEDFNARPNQNNIALLRLAKPVSLNENVMPICLPVTPSMRKHFPKFSAVGWGRTETDCALSRSLQRTKMAVLPQDECNKWLSKYAKKIRHTNTLVCATTGALSANGLGDAGGPLQTISKVTGRNRYVQYGIFAYGTPFCGNVSHPETYIRVESFVDWILNNLEE